MREINLDQLRTLLAIVDLGSLAKASSALNLVQSTISLHLKELESRLRVRLLDRNKQGVTVTPEGAILIEHARELLKMADKAVNAIRNHREGVTSVVRIGASASLIAHHLPAVLKKVATHHSNIRVELVVTTTVVAKEQLLNGQLDLALIVNNVKQAGLTITRWSVDPLVAYLPASWHVPRRVTPAWLQTQPLLMNEPGSSLHHQTMQWFAKAGFLPHAHISLNNGEALKNLVAAGYGAAILPLESAQQNGPQDIQIHNITPAIKRLTFMAHKTSRSMPHALRTVIEIFQESKQTVIYVSTSTKN